MPVDVSSTFAKVFSAENLRVSDPSFKRALMLAPAAAPKQPALLRLSQKFFAGLANPECSQKLAMTSVSLAYLGSSLWRRANAKTDAEKSAANMAIGFNTLMASPFILDTGAHILGDLSATRRIAKLVPAALPALQKISKLSPTLAKLSCRASYIVPLLWMGCGIAYASMQSGHLKNKTFSFDRDVSKLSSGWMTGLATSMFAGMMWSRRAAPKTGIGAIANTVAAAALGISAYYGGNYLGQKASDVAYTKMAATV